MKPWLVITITGTTAAAIVTSLTYTAAVKTSDATALTTGFTIKTLGNLGSHILSYFLGPSVGGTVRLISNISGDIAYDTIHSSGRKGAIVLSASAGALTALSITAGSYIVEYSIEYGGEISAQMAKFIAEQYIKLKSENIQDIQTKEFTIQESNLVKRICYDDIDDDFNNSTDWMIISHNDTV